MEESQNEQVQQTQETPSVQPNPQSNVSFPTVGAQRKSSGSKSFLVIGILILVAILGFVIYKSATKEDQTLAEPTPFDNLSTTDQTVEGSGHCRRNKQDQASDRFYALRNDNAAL